jgi:hypothetical protein
MQYVKKFECQIISFLYHKITFKIIIYNYLICYTTYYCLFIIIIINIKHLFIVISSFKDLNLFL